MSQSDFCCIKIVTYLTLLKMSSFKEMVHFYDKKLRLVSNPHRSPACLLSNPFQGPFCNVAKETRVFSSEWLIFQWMVDVCSPWICFESWNVGKFFGGKSSRDFGVFGPENHVAISTQTIIHSDVGKQVQNFTLYYLYLNCWCTLGKNLRRFPDYHKILLEMPPGRVGTGWGRVKSPATNDLKTTLSEQPYEQGSHDQHDEVTKQFGPINLIPVLFYYEAPRLYPYVLLAHLSTSAL